MTETTYLDIKAQQIQAYLGRTNQLWGRRGASRLLNDAMRDIGALPPGAAVHHEGGDIDGVTSLTLNGLAPETIIDAVLPRLRQLLPGLSFEVTWGAGATYADAYPALAEQRADGATVMLLAPTATVPVVARCSVCGLDPATTTTPLPGVAGPQRVCSDCAARRQASLPEVDGGDQRVSRHEATLLAALPGVSRTVQDFTALARIGAPTTDDGRAAPSGDYNHLATVFIDGNSIGRFMTEVIARGMDKSAISAGLAQATLTALTEATRVVQEQVVAAAGDTPFLAVIPHVVGGDDVMVSVPARQGWTFARAYVVAFKQAMVSLCGEHGIDVPSASAGVVFAHASHPFSRLHEIAEEALDAAKRVNGGKEAAVMWVDVTAEGETPAVGRRAWTFRDIQQQSGALSALTDVPQSARSNLVRAAADGSAARVWRLIGKRKSLSVLEEAAAVSVQRVADMLSISKWWVG